MGDALSRNMTDELRTIVAQYLAHPRRDFVDPVEVFPKPNKSDGRRRKPHQLMALMGGYEETVPGVWCWEFWRIPLLVGVGMRILANSTTGRCIQPTASTGSWLSAQPPSSPLRPTSHPQFNR
ncbi:MAG: hypothetical protein KatS3mg111_3753 [Pirellulaceae bacterium]|nr:MAG: hypothetical protein KatS3mg111_3753 [Pirellulaceae bacterium]